MLIDHFILFTSRKRFVSDIDEEPEMIIDIETMKLKELLNKPIVSFSFSQRAKNCFVLSNIVYVKDVVKMSREELLGIKSLGKKTFSEIEQFLNNNNLNFGMDIKKYEL